ncbi:hypothetical protein C8R47DRAFT_1214063 [Mycena vitilis]|nr:hypothetical protein C8R47DRAFT_1214063 [Mycena vitilis]
MSWVCRLSSTVETCAYAPSSSMLPNPRDGDALPAQDDDGTTVCNVCGLHYDLHSFSGWIERRLPVRFTLVSRFAALLVILRVHLKLVPRTDTRTHSYDTPSLLSWRRTLIPRTVIRITTSTAAVRPHRHLGNTRVSTPPLGVGAAIGYGSDADAAAIGYGSDADGGHARIVAVPRGSRTAASECPVNEGGANGSGDGGNGNRSTNGTGGRHRVSVGGENGAMVPASTTVVYFVDPSMPLAAEASACRFRPAVGSTPADAFLRAGTDDGHGHN